MQRLKIFGLAAVATAALVCLPSAPAAAAGPLLFAPWALGHLLRAVTAPLAVAAAAASASYGYGAPAYSGPPSYYGPGYGALPTYGPPAYYPAPSYYPPQSSYYAPSASYYAGPPAYYPYGRPYVRYYGSRGYDAPPRLRYAGPHGTQGWHGGNGYYRRR